MFLQTCAPGAGCGGFSIARKSRERPDGFLNIYGQNKEEKTGDVLSPYQNIQPFKGFYVYLHGIGEIFNLHAFVRQGFFCPRIPGPKATAFGSFLA